MTSLTMPLPEVAATAAAPRVGFWPRVWQALEAHGQKRAAAELRQLAVLRFSNDPEQAQRLRDLARKV